MRRLKRVLGFSIAALVALAALEPRRAPAALVLAFGTAPSLPALPTIALNGRAQVTTAQMSNFSVIAALEGVFEHSPSSGWNLTVSGDTASGDSPVFAQYCPNSGGCGKDNFGYVPGGQTLPEGSLTLNTTGASFSTLLGNPASFTCETPCALDSTSASKIATESKATTLATWTSTGFSPSSLALTTPTTLKTLPASEVYRLNVVWTLSTGP